MSHHSIAHDHLMQNATLLHEAAETLPHGDAREFLVHRAIKMEAASLIIERWASSPSLRAPR
jgi:hypothetical protein